MAYLKSLNFSCEFGACRKGATQQLYGWQNNPMLRYCTEHSKWALRAQQRKEVT